MVDWTRVLGYNEDLTSPGDYEHCENCSFYHLEQQLDPVQGAVVGAPRNLIGRSLMTGNLTWNKTDSTQMISLEYPDQGIQGHGAFIGVGVCCELGWCPPECEGNGGHATLIGWLPGESGSGAPEVLAVAPAVADAQTAQLGIAFDTSGYPAGPSGDRVNRASLIAGGQIFTFNVTVDSRYSYPTLKAQLMETSPPVTKHIQAWWYSGF